MLSLAEDCEAAAPTFLALAQVCEYAGAARCTRCARAVRVHEA